MTGITIRCINAPRGECFTAGVYYDVFKVVRGDDSIEDKYYFIDDDGDRTIAYYPSDFRKSSDDCLTFELVENSEESFTTPEEDAEWQRLDQKQQEGVLCKDHVHIGWVQKETTAPEEPVDCPVAIAYHIHELQKWLKHVGCSSEAEFRISSDYVWASPDEFVIYEAKEGGVGTLIEYMRHIGGANKCVEKMEDVG